MSDLAKAFFASAGGAAFLKAALDLRAATASIDGEADLIVAKDGFDDAVGLLAEAGVQVVIAPAPAEPEPDDLDTGDWSVGDRAGCWDFGDRGEIVSFEKRADGVVIAQVQLDYAKPGDLQAVPVDDLDVLTDD